jgi:hypothetical protein
MSHQTNYKKLAKISRNLTLEFSMSDETETIKEIICKVTPATGKFKFIVLKNEKSVFRTVSLKEAVKTYNHIE